MHDARDNVRGGVLHLAHSRDLERRGLWFKEVLGLEGHSARVEEILVSITPDLQCSKFRT